MVDDNSRSFKKQAIEALNYAMRPIRLQLVPSWRVEQLTEFERRFAVSYVDQPVSPVLEAYLQREGHLLEKLRSYYAAVGLDNSAWAPRAVRSGVDLSRFRSDNLFVFQARSVARMQYVETARYVRSIDRLGLANRFTEDGQFGALTVDVDGWTVSRDLLDSILEINFLSEYLGIFEKERETVIDIGAGYGRLAERVTALAPKMRYICADGIAESTFLQKFYLGYRRSNAEVETLDNIKNLRPEDKIGLAINIHSFPEMPMATSGWWIDHVARCGVPNFFLVTDYVAGLTAVEADGRRHGDITDHLLRNGYRLKVDRPKYDSSRISPDYQLFPARYQLFQRT